MKIATWNLERPKLSSKTRNAKIIERLKEIDADILILTETNSIIHPGIAYTSFATPALPLSEGSIYSVGENRTTIWSKYPGSKHIETYDRLTSHCIGIQTPIGHLNIYGTIIGIYGNREESFKVDLKKQLEDWRKICTTGSICIAGDFNITFADNYYYTKEGRQKINDCFSELSINNLTHQIPESIDHIAISTSFLKSSLVKTEVWNEDKSLSDHIGVCVSLE